MARSPKTPIKPDLTPEVAAVGARRPAPADQVPIRGPALAALMKPAVDWASGRAVPATHDLRCATCSEHRLAWLPPEDADRRRAAECPQCNEPAVLVPRRKA